VRKLLFDPRPKTSRSDLYDFEEELERLSHALSEPMVLVSGLRRTGKTSLVLTALNESGLPHVYVDLREGFTSSRELYVLLSRSLSDFVEHASRWGRAREVLLRALSRVRGVSVMGLQVSVSWSPRERPLLGELFAALDELGERLGGRIVVVFDEFQRSRGSVGVALHSAIAHSYDFHRNLSFVLTGSEMGVLYGILRNPENPLYGRAYVEIRTRKLSREEALDFLERGFAEAGVRVSASEVERAVEELDGIIGWLAYYGYLRVGGRGDLERVVEEAVELARSELESFLATRVSRRYRLVLKLLAQGVREWGRLKRALEDAEGRELSDRVLHEILHQLRSHSIIDEENNFTDPVVRRAALQL
jgi:AAA+ ATPase superfamily predicted ATPase